MRFAIGTGLVRVWHGFGTLDTLVVSASARDEGNG